MTSRERVLTTLNHKEPDRVPIFDTPAMSTLKRWHEEGLSFDVSPAEYFNYDMIWFLADTTPRFPSKIIQETEEYTITTTPYGGVQRNHKDYSTTPEVIDYPCKSRQDWRKIKNRLTPSPERVDWRGEKALASQLWGLGAGQQSEKSSSETNQALGKFCSAEWRTGLKGCRKAREDGKFICYWASVGYDKIQNYVPSELLLMAIATNPDWVRDMYETDARLVIGMYEIMKERGFEFDGAWLCCDLGYRNGLLFSPHHFQEQLRPVLQYLFNYFNAQGMPIILHSDGCVRDLIPYFIEDGVNCLEPVETKAKMDLFELKKQFGDKLAFMGGIDVRAMADADPFVIENEIKTKVPFAKKGGGYIYVCDADVVPKNVSFKQYCRIIKLVRKYGLY